MVFPFVFQLSLNSLSSIGAVDLLTAVRDNPDSKLLTLELKVSIYKEYYIYVHVYQYLSALIIHSNLYEQKSP